ncbi:hypothetical protein RUM44_004509 [Polyplax serrata]|uniref:Protein-lysine N-methyltransferase RUM44_004509 n=1 Tax=Polyplax serrata TaxID=468196 RepID=A0ABR1B330_POLSC
MNESMDDDQPTLRPETLKALQEFLQEQELREEKGEFISENWQLSQFWYDDSTTFSLSSSAVSKCSDGGKIALISCPTLYPAVKSQIRENERDLTVTLFEFDKRFSKYGTDFIHYDYNSPINLDFSCKNAFDIIIIDPPFLSEECLTKVVETVNFIKKTNSKIILCTGGVMEDLARKLLGVKKCSFEPKHKNNLANEFICLTNFGELS